MTKNLLYIIILFINLLNCPVFAQNLNEKYEITLWSKDIKGNCIKNHLETIGFLPVYKNTQDEVTIDKIKVIYKSYLNIQILENQNNKIKVLLDFNNDQKKYTKVIFLNNKEIKDIEDFKIKIEIK